MIAADRGFTEITQILIAKGANVEAFNSVSSTNAVVFVFDFSILFSFNRPMMICYSVHHQGEGRRFIRL